MKKAILTACLAVSVAGCITTPASYTKSDLSSRQSDMDACQVDALSKAPRAIEASGVDRNFDLRMRIFDKCMSGKGYTKS